MKARALSLASLVLIFLQCQAALPVEQSDSETIRTINALETMFDDTQEQFLPISPPSRDAYIHSPDAVIPVDWQLFTELQFRRAFRRWVPEGEFSGRE